MERPTQQELLDFLKATRPRLTEAEWRKGDPIVIMTWAIPLFLKWQARQLVSKVCRVVNVGGEDLAVARCSFCEDSLVVPVQDVADQIQGGTPWLCSACRNIPEAERARINAIPDNAISE